MSSTCGSSHEERNCPIFKISVESSYHNARSKSEELPANSAGSIQQWDKRQNLVFFEEFQQLPQSFPPELVLGADETMIKMSNAHKAVTDERMAISGEAFENQVPHTPVMLIYIIAYRRSIR
jgi:hypothetical protein